MNPIKFDSRLLGALEMITVYSTERKPHIHVTDPKGILDSTIFSEDEDGNVWMELFAGTTPTSKHKIEDPSRYGIFGSAWIIEFYDF